MNRGIFRDLLPGDIAYIAENLRKADRQEVIAATGATSMKEAIAEAVLRSSHCWTGALPDGEPVTIFGVAPVALLGSVGSPWMLGTERMFDFPRVLMGEGRRYLTRMLRLYPHLVNYVDARNARSVRWLARVGFTVHEPQPFGEAGLPFHRFEMRA